MSEGYETEDIPGDYGLPIRTDITRDNGGIIPGGPHPVRLKDGERVWAKEGDQIVEYIHEVDIFGEQWRLRKTGRTTKRKRKARTKVWKQTDGKFKGFWRYDCSHCTIGPGGGPWRTIYDIANHHARTH